MREIRTYLRKNIYSDHEDVATCVDSDCYPAVGQVVNITTFQPESHGFNSCHGRSTSLFGLHPFFEYDLI